MEVCSILWLLFSRIQLVCSNNYWCLKNKADHRIISPLKNSNSTIIHSLSRVKLLRRIRLTKTAIVSRIFLNNFNKILMASNLIQNLWLPCFRIMQWNQMRKCFILNNIKNKMSVISHLLYLTMPFNNIKETL
jgi:hypothetical protein